MNDKYAKEIAKELRLIRKELEKQRAGSQVSVDGIDPEVITNAITEEIERQERMRR